MSDSSAIFRFFGFDSGFGFGFGFEVTANGWMKFCSILRISWSDGADTFPYSSPRAPSPTYRISRRRVCSAESFCRKTFRMIIVCYVEQSLHAYLHHCVPPPRLEAEDHSVSPQSHRRELEKVAAENHLDASERKIVAPKHARRVFQRVEETAVQHGDLVDDQHAARLPAIHRAFVLTDLAKRVVQVHFGDAQAGEGVDGDSSDVAGCDACRSGHEHFVLSHLLLERLHKHAEQIALSGTRVACEKNVL